MLLIMSEDLEARSAWYRNMFGDEDIADILEVAAKMSRKRNRPEHFVEAGKIDETIISPTQESQELDPEWYFFIQSEILDILATLALKRDRRYSNEEREAIFREFNIRYGRYIPDNLDMRYLTMLNFFNKPNLSYERIDTLHTKIERIDVSIRSIWNRIMHQMALWHPMAKERARTVGGYRNTPDHEIGKLTNIGRISIHVFRTALQN